MERGEKRSFDMMEMEDPPVAIYEYSEIELRNLEAAADDRPPFYGMAELDYNTKVAAMKASSFVVSLVSFSGASVLNQSCGAIIESEGNTNTVITSLNLIRKSEGAKYLEDNLFENSKVIIRADDDNCYLGEILFFDFFYNFLVLRFKSESCFQSAKLSMIDDATSLDREVPLRRHSNKTKSGDCVIVLGRYFYQPYDYMAAPGVLSLERFMPNEYDCNELLTIKCLYTRCGDGAPVISTSGGLLGITFFDLGSGTRPLLPINILARLLEHHKKHGEMRHPSYGFDARNVHLAVLPTLLKFHKAFPDIQDGLIVQRVFKDFNAELAGLEVDDVIFTCDGIPVKSFFELWNLMFEKVGMEVELEVARVALKTVQTLRVKVGEAAVDEEIYRWLRFD